MAGYYKDLPVDPWNSDNIPEYYHIQSIGYSGTDYTDIIAPATPNYPPLTPARYFLNLPVIPYVGDFITYPMLIKDMTTSTVLTRVASSPGVNQYAYSPSTSKTPHKIELHSGQAGHQIAYDYYGTASVINAINVDQPIYRYVLPAGTSHTVACNLQTGKNYKLILRANSINAALAKIIWNGDTTASRYQTAFVATYATGNINTDTATITPRGVTVNLIALNNYTKIYVGSTYISGENQSVYYVGSPIQIFPFQSNFVYDNIISAVTSITIDLSYTPGGYFSAIGSIPGAIFEIYRVLEGE